MIKVLIVGYGSIGRRHANLLSALDLVEKVTVLSKQRDIPFESP